MTAQQAEAYTELTALLTAENGVTLRPAETERLRMSADALFFDEENADEAREAAQGVLDSLVESERWSEERASSLAATLDACGRVPVTA